MPEILLVTLCGVIAGAEGWEDIEAYGASKLALLREILPFAHGAPSDDTLRHVALHFLQAAKQKRDSIKRLRKQAGWDDDTLKRILKIS